MPAAQSKPHWKRNLVLPLVLTVLVGLTPALAQEAAEEAEMQAATAEEMSAYLGQWVLRVTSARGEFDAELEVLMESGEIAATLDLGPLGRQSIDSFYKTDAGLDMRFEANLGGQAFKMKMPTAFEGDELVGTVSDSAGFLSLDFRGITEARAQDLERAGERERIRISRGDETTKRAELEFGEDEVAIRFDTAKTEEAAYDQIEELSEGVVRFLQHQSTKLFTDIDLVFGNTVVKTENISDDYPGVYSLWLEKSGSGWNLVFNEKADVWGHQYDPEGNAARVPLQFSADSSPEVEAFTVELAQAESGGTVQISWGPYRWSTNFTVE